jgi:protein-S-isoprenylcysteine O-methyltransferase Ste14
MGIQRGAVIRQLFSFILPFTVEIVVPFLLLFDFRRRSLRLFLPHPVLQGVAGGLLIIGGLALLAATVSRFIRQGRGTLAPWDPPRRLVIEGPYAHTRNPMISGSAASPSCFSAKRLCAVP